MMEMVKKNPLFLPSYSDRGLKDPDSVNAVLVDYSGVTSAHGVPRIITSKSTTSRLFWSLVTFVALGAFLWQGSLLLYDFRGHPYTTQIDVVTRTELQFPAVTVCNMNLMRRSAMVNTRFESLIESDGVVKDDDYSWWFDWSSGRWREFEEEQEYDLENDVVSTSENDVSGDSATDGSGLYPATIFTVNPYWNGTANETSIPPHLEYIRSGEEELLTPLNFTEVPIEHKAMNHTPIHPNQNDSTSTDVVTDTATSDGIPSSVGEESSNTGEGAPVRKRRSGLRVIPDPVTGKVDHRGRHVRRKRQLGEDSLTSSEQPEDYDWWESDWETDMFDYQTYDWNGVTDDNDWEGFYRMSTADDFSDLLDVINPTREELREMGHQAEDFILQCTFDRRPCNYTHFRQFQNKYYGNCFTFNQEVGNSSGARWTGKTGAQYGLHLTLFTEQPEYVGLFAQEAGVRVAIHPPNVSPFPEDDGVVASTGQATNIGIRQSFYKRLPHPHGNCTDGTGTNFTSDEYTYTTRACVKSCVQQHLVDKCGCVTDIMLNDTICSPRNRSQQVCRQAIEQFFHEGRLECLCPIACEETLFGTAVTSSLWPSERYETHLISRLTNEKAQRILQNVEQTRKNLARLRIYFEELNYEQMIQDPKYTHGSMVYGKIESLLGGIGGLLGLYIGFSMITVIEVGALVVDLVKFVFRKAYSRDKVVPVDFIN